MTREEILNKSRQDNQYKDLFEKEVSVKAGNIGAIVAVILATVFFVVQILLGIGMEYGLYAVVFSVPATGYIVKSIRLKGKRNIAFAVIFTLATVTFSAAHIAELISASTIL